MSIFTGFTFTDLEDFMPLATLVVGLIGVFIIQRSAQDKASRPLLSLLLLLSLWPILLNIGLFFLARELQSISGSWPQVMVDDPKNWLGHASPRFDALFHLVAYLEAFSGAWMILFLALYFVIRPRLSPDERRFCVSLTLVSIFLVLLDPGNLDA